MSRYASAWRLVPRFVEQHNQIRLHSTIGYLAPDDKLLGRDKVSHDARDQKLADGSRVTMAYSANFRRVDNWS